MSELNVTHNKLRRRSYPTLEQAVKAAYDGDTITIHIKSNKLSTGYMPVDKTLYIRGADPSNVPTIMVNTQQVAFFLQQGDLHLSNVNISLTNQARGIVAATNYGGEIILNNVNILHTKKIKPREYWPSIIAIGTQQQSILNANITMKHCSIDYLQIAASNLMISDSHLGKLPGLQSILRCLGSQFNNTELTHLEIQYENSNPKQPSVMNGASTKGLLSLLGNFKINGLKFVNGIQKSNSPLSFLGSNPVKVLADYQVTSPMPMLLTSSYRGIINQVKINKLTYDQSFFQLQPDTALVHPYSFNLYGTGVGISNSTIMPNRFGDKNITVKGALMLEDVKDKSEWNDKNTNVSSRGKTQSKLFSQLPTGNNIHGNKNVDPIQKLKSLIGLKDVKNTLLDLIAAASVRHMKKKAGMPVQPMSMHMVFQGDPGTGKTTVARLVGKALYKKGVTNSSKFVEVEGNDLMAGYEGQTKGLVRGIVGKARGGILFIDEAYALANKPGSNNEFADEAVDELIAQMENHRDDLIVIMAGYKYQMQQFFRNGNPGLKSRFTHIIDFPDYSAEDMRQILQLMINKDKQQLANPQAGEAMVKGLKTVMDAQQGMSGNGRLVRNFLQAVETKRDRRIALSGKMSLANASTIEASDARQATDTELKKLSNEN